MYDNKPIIFIGPLGGRKIPTNGAAIKNYYITHYLKNIGGNIHSIDTQRWKSNPLILIKLFLYLLIYRNSKFIISTSCNSAFKIIQTFHYFQFKQDLIYWVIGGNLAKNILQKHINVNLFSKLSAIIVEGNTIKQELNKLNIKNVIVVPNFKIIKNLPPIQNRTRDKVSFLFISRIIPEKGCDLILKAIDHLNRKGLGSKFNVSFYGDIAPKYSQSFLCSINSIKNAEYKGFLDLRDTQNYNLISDFDVMLFPTFWSTEGFPGIIIDAFIAGIPVIASDWNMNSEIIEDRRTGFIIEPRNWELLSSVMEDIILGKVEIGFMKIECQKQAKKYDINAVLNKSVLNKIGII